MFNIFKKINDFFVNFFDFVSFRKNNPVLNNDVESCCVLLNDDTNTLTE
jgi:hypothetical protein